MSVVDLVLIGLALAFAFSGFRQGVIVSATSFFGFFGGAVLGAQLSEPVADRFDGTATWRVMVCQAGSATACSPERTITLSN